MSVPAKLLLLAICLLTFGASLQSFAREYSVVYFLRGPMNDQIEALAHSSHLPEPTSARTTRELLFACGRILTTAPRVKADTVIAAKVRLSCGAIVQAVLQNAPTNGRARAVALLTSLPDLSVEAYTRAQEAAPSEPWPLRIRLDALSLAPPGGSDLLAVAAQDIARAVATDWGREVAAKLYKDRDDLRETITEVAEGLPPNDQAAFVQALRNAVSESN